MAKTLDDAIEAVLYHVSHFNGLRKVANPQERFSIDPFATAFPGPGEFQIVSSGMTKGLQHIILEIHKVRKDLPRDLEIIIPYGELVKDFLTIDANRTLPDSAGADTVDTIIGCDYDFGPLGWADVDTLGWQFDIEVKIW